MSKVSSQNKYVSALVLEAYEIAEKAVGAETARHVGYAPMIREIIYLLTQETPEKAAEVKEPVAPKKGPPTKEKTPPKPATPKAQPSKQKGSKDPVIANARKNPKSLLIPTSVETKVEDKAPPQAPKRSHKKKATSKA
jgi:hypothetical protein